ncbi:hypothetical protein P4S72_23395 [Vibrio sp. PP-XX7]
MRRKAEEQIERKVKSAPLGLIVHTLKEVNEQLQKGHFFFKDIREQGILLYNANGKELVEPGDLTEAERREIAQGHFDQWFKSASTFLKGYRNFFNDGDLKEAAFMLHQVTERFFACTLLTLTNYLPKPTISKNSKNTAPTKIWPSRIFSPWTKNSTAAASAACNGRISMRGIRCIMRSPGKS